PVLPQLPDFEFDEAKSRMNLEKHGIDFEQAKALWLDPKRREVPARSDDEPRFAVVGLVDGRHWTAYITYRGERVRLISVRRSRPSEVARYEHHD
ncbi:MAG: BrnT family toxin, partial [Longimicrobiales bacterium]|nr:BrnT family toxin [Longimicrobiales bacterium]